MPSDLGKTLFIANPAAQRGNGAQAAQIVYDLLVEWLGEGNVERVLTERPKHATELAASASRERFDTVITLGGDGAVHEVVNGLMQLAEADRPIFGLVPVGSGNDYARTLGMSECVPDAVVQLIGAREQCADVGRCNGEYFAETLSFGLDAAIALDTVQRRERTGEQGTVLYLKSGLGQLMHHLDTYQMNGLLCNGDEQTRVSEPILMMAVQVGPTYGGGFRICPDARIDDGLLDICYATAPMNVLEATIKFLSAKNAHHTRWKNIHFGRASSLELSFDRRPPCQIDGEPHIADSYAIDVLPDALRVLVAADEGGRSRSTP